MGFDPTGDFQGLAGMLKAPQYGQVNPNLAMPLGHTMRGIALQNAMNTLKGGDIRLQGEEEDLGNREKMNQMNDRNAGPLDWMGALMGGIGVLNKKSKNSSGMPPLPGDF